MTYEIGGKLIDLTWNLSVTGMVLAPPVLSQLGWIGLAQTDFALALLAALLIWLVSAAQMARRTLPGPLRTLLALHLSTAVLLLTTATLLGQTLLADALLAMLCAGHWVLAAGFAPLCGAMTFPLAAFATALLI